MNGSNIYDLVSAFAWPAALILVAVIYKSKFSRLAEAFVQKFENAKDVKLGSIELKGPIVDPATSDFCDPNDNVPITGNGYEKIAASKEERESRDAAYRSTKNLMLAHRIRPSSKEKQKFDISLFLVRKESKHAKTASYKDVVFVEYYLGSYFGEKPNGSKYLVKNPDNGFAMTISAYGSPLCIATIHFVDGTITETSRFLDFEMGAVFDKAASAS